MQRLILGILVIVVLLSTTGCNLISRPATPDVQVEVIDLTSGTEEVSAQSDAVSPTATPQPGVYVLSLSLPEYIKVDEPLDVVVSLVGSGDVSELAFVLDLPIMYLYVNDENMEVEGLQARVAPLPSTAAVVENVVSSDGLYHFRATGLGTGEKANRTIVTLRLHPISLTDSKIPVQFKDVVLLGSDGQPLDFVSQSVLVSITEDGLPITDEVAEPTTVTTKSVSFMPAITSGETESPVATPVLDPTPVSTATPETTPEPTVAPTATPPSPTATPLPTPVPSQASTASSGIAAGVYYRIQRGETLFRIAHRYGTTPAAIAEATGIADVTAISVGALLRIPVQPANGQAMYIVSKGDTFYNIATTFGLTTQELAARNPLIAPHYLQPGQWVILVP